MKKLMIICLILISAFSVCFAGSAKDVIDQLKTVKSYQADFVQYTEIEGFGEDEYSGKLYIKSGEKAFWDYDKPYRQFYLFDTATMKYFDSETKQMIVQKLDPATNVFMRLMLNPAQIEGDFTVTLKGDELTLEPKGDLGIETIIFKVSGGLVTGISTKDQSGNNTRIVFKNIVRDKTIAKEVFEPSLPADTEIFEYK